MPVGVVNPHIQPGQTGYALAYWDSTVPVRQSPTADWYLLHNSATYVTWATPSGWVITAVTPPPTNFTAPTGPITVAITVPANFDPTYFNTTGQVSFTGLYDWLSPTLMDGGDGMGYYGPRMGFGVVIDPSASTNPVQGCTNPAATNYNPLATVDNGSCVFPVIVAGCTDPRATNYNPTATVDNGSCVLPALPVRGCTDPTAINYNGLAAQSDGSCQYAVPVPTQAPPFVAACPCLWTATLLPIKSWAIVVPPVGTWIQKPC